MATVVAVGVASVFGRIPLVVVALALAIPAAGELYRIERARGIRPVPLVGLAATAGLFVAAAIRGERAPTVLGAITVASVALTFAAYLARRSRQDATRGTLSTILPVLLVGLLGAYVVAMRGIPHGARLVVGFLVITLFADVVASRAPVSPFPRLAAAIAGALAGAIPVGLVLDPAYSPARAVVLALIAAPIVAASSSVTNMITALPPQPGVRQPRATVLHRIDAAVFTAPLFFYAFRALAR